MPYYKAFCKVSFPLNTHRMKRIPHKSWNI